MVCMTRKYVKDMNKEELTKVFHANQKLRDDIYEDMVETEMHYIGEQLDYLKDGLSDWSIGANQRNYMYISNADDFIYALEETEKVVPILLDDDSPKLQQALDLREAFRSEDIDSDGFDDLEEQLEVVANELADIVVKRFTAILDGCDKEEWQIDYLIDFYADSRLDKDMCYINLEDENYILYEDMIKSYK